MCVHDGGQQLTEGTDIPKPENIVKLFFTSIYVWSEYSLTGWGGGGGDCGTICSKTLKQRTILDIKKN